MTNDYPKKIKKVSSREKKAAEGEKISPGGLHFGDYRPRYQETFDIYEKAKKHVREQKKHCKSERTENKSENEKKV